MRGLRAPPPGLVDLREFAPELHFDVRYATAANFTGAPLPGYGAPGAWLHPAAAAALRAAHRALAGDGLGLLVFDAYRPFRATLAMVSWAEATGNDHLLQGYIGRRSAHNRGTAVDVGLCDGAGALRDAGSDFDAFGPAGHVDGAVGAPAAARQTLADALGRAGWRPYWREWWHFSFPVDPEPPAYDIPYGVDEPDPGEGWTPP